MAYSVVQAGTSLQFIDNHGIISNLTLPTGVTLRSDIPPRFTLFNGFVVLVNTPSTPLTIDANGVVRPLTPKPPKTTPTLSAGNAGSLSGTYSGARYTFIIEDANGVLLSESDFSPPSNSVTIASKNLKISGLEVSSEDVTARRVYRSTTGGTTLFSWIQVDGNVITEAQDDLADAGLSLIAAPDLGNPNHLIIVAPWRERLWGVDDKNGNQLKFARPDAMWAWPDSNSIAVPSSGRDESGIRSLMPRREALGVGRRDIIYQVTGTTSDDFQVVKLSENTGVESHETVAVYRDTVFWLWKDGVYQWDGDGLRNISDGSVSSWFNTTSYFNQNEFKNAFAVFDPSRLKYRLFLAAAGGTQINRWVEYDLAAKTWWGPHKTAAFDPTSAFILSDDEDKTRAIFGTSNGFIFQETITPSDDETIGIDLDVDTKFFDGGVPDYDKYWGQLSMLGKAQSTGTMTITCKTGYLGAQIQAPITYNMNKGRERLRRLGNGKLMQLNFKHTTAGEPVELYGFQLPYHILGRR